LKSDVRTGGGGLGGGELKGESATTGERARERLLNGIWLGKTERDSAVKGEDASHLLRKEDIRRLFAEGGIVHYCGLEERSSSCISEVERDFLKERMPPVPPAKSPTK